MVVEDVAVFQEGAIRQHEGSQVFASSMVGERDVRLKVAPEVQRAKLDCASLMVEDAVVSSSVVLKVHKAVRCSVKRMVVERDAYLLGAQKVLKGVPLCAKDMVVESAASLTGVGYAQKVCMGAQITVLHMGVERGVRFLVVQRAHVAALIAV